MFDTPSFRSFDDWREASRAELASSAPAGAPLALPRRLMLVLRNVACFRHAGRWELMTRLARRTLVERRDLIDDIVDPDVRHACDMDKAVRRDLHKMHAFVRFRECVDDAGVQTYLAWFEPQHEILSRAAQFFVKRFANMRWAIATPDGTAVWDGQSLNVLAVPAARPETERDASEDLWRTYYRSICNVARINPRAMRREMPQRYWIHMPETAEIGELLRHGQERLAQQSVTADIRATAAARALERAGNAGTEARTDIERCQRCSLWQRATQVVRGEGPASAQLMLVGEQPGDEEDLRGQPFVGPAGRLLNDLLREADLERADLYITNAVKHFKWEPRGKRRLHRRPEAAEVAACHDWLRQEIDTVGPRVIVALGATAMLSLLGSRESIEASRGRPLQHVSGARVLVSYHPSALLRAAPESSARLRSALVEDLHRAAALAAESQSSPAAGAHEKDGQRVAGL
jgi:uracil-DNA glycosylase